MEVVRVWGHVVCSLITLGLCVPASASDKPTYPTSIETYARYEGGAKVISVAYPSTDLNAGGSGGLDIDSDRVDRRTLTVKSGRTLSDMLHSAGISRGETASAVKVLGRHTNLRRLQIGQKVTLYLKPRPRPEVGAVLIGLALDQGKRDTVVVYSDFNKRFSGQRLPHDEAIALLESVVVVDSGVAANGGDGFVNRDLVLRKGENINRLLINNGATKQDGHMAAQLLAKHVDVRRMRIGQKITVTFETFADNRPARLAGVAITMPGKAIVVVGRGRNGDWHLGPADIGSAEIAMDAKISPPAQPDEKPEPAAVSPDFVDSLPVVVAGSEREAPAGRSEIRIVELRRGDRLFDRLMEVGATRSEADRAVKDLGKVTNLRRLRIGETFRLTFVTPEEGGRAQLTGLSVNTKGKGLIVLGWPLEGTERTVTAGKRIQVTPVPEIDPVPSTTPAPAPSAKMAAAPAQEAVPVQEQVAPHDGVPLSREITVHEVSRGDNLFSLLKSHGVSNKEIDLATRALRRIYNPNSLRIGRRVIVDVEHTDAGVVLGEVTLQSGKRSGVAVRANARGQYDARKVGANDFAATIAGAKAQTAARLVASESGTLPTAAVAKAVPAKKINDLETRLNGYAVTDVSGGNRATVVLKRGSTLMEALMGAGSQRADAHMAIQSIRELYDPRRLREGQSISVTLINSDEGVARIGGVSLALDVDSRLDVVRLDDGSFVSGFVDRELVTDYRRVEGTIDTSLYDAVLGAGVPHAVLMDLIRVYSFDIDFQREIQRGDSFEMMYEMLVDDTGMAVKPGDILYARMTVSGDDKELYRFEMASGRVDYFDSDGKSSRKALMRTPIDGARLSSGFGMRKHPILRYSRMHKGLDFAAPRGTPIYAAGDGVVERASRYGAYGKYVRIRHNSDYTTAYAHMNGYAKGIYPGKRVQQGQTIGYVGTTGRSTGPHLHYEVVRRGKQVNPLSVKLPTGTKLAATDVANFMEQRDKLIALFQELPTVAKVAKASE